MHNKRKPLYQQIHDHFKELIVSGKLQENDKIPSETEIMEQFEVSRITVVNAMAGLAKEGLIYRIPGRGSFVKLWVNNPADSISAFEGLLSSKQENRYPSGERSLKRKIGLVLLEIGDYFAIRLLKGITECINETDFELLIMFTYNDIKKERQIIQDMIVMGVEGLLIFPCDAEIYNEEILSLKMNGFPFVLMDRFLPGVETNFICADSTKGAQLAVSHLWELGHRDIAFFSDVPLPTVTVQERIDGYMRELKLRGALIDPSLIVADFVLSDLEVHEDHVLYKFMKSGRASSFIASNMKLGQLIYRYAVHLGLRVPQDISIVTFDNPTPGYDERGAYTYINQFEEQIGRQAATILTDILSESEHKSAQSYQKVILEPQLVVKGTTGPLSTNKVSYM